MKKILQIVSWLALAGIVVPPFLYFGGTMAHEALKNVMLGATIVWFVTAPFWMNQSQA